MGSADWMPRNLDKRVEITFPVEDEACKKRVMDVLRVQLADNVKAHILQPDGSYEKVDKRGKTLICAQDYFCQQAIKEAVGDEGDDEPQRVFEPLYHAVSYTHLTLPTT